MEAAQTSTLLRKELAKRKLLVPWWTLDCTTAIKDGNKAFKKLKRTNNYIDLIEYKIKLAIGMRNIKMAKREYWREYCDLLGKGTPLEKVWSTIKNMAGQRKRFGYPIMGK